MNILVSFGLLVLTMFSAVSWGKLLFTRMTRRGWSRGESLLLRAGLGLGVISYLIFFSVLGGFLYRPVVFAILLLPLVRYLPFRKKEPRGTVRVFSFSRMELFSFILILAVLGLNIVSSLTPPWAGDAIGYHLPPPRAYLAAHRLVWLEGNVLANQPAAVGTLFTVGFAGGGEFFPNLLHCLFGLMSAAAVYLFGRRPAGRSAAALGALIFYTVPSVARVSSWAYIDLGLTFWTVLALFSYLRWKEGAGSFVLIGLFGGLAMGSKYTGLVLFALLAVLAFIDCARHRERRLFCGKVVSFSAIALLVAAPWYLKNLWMTGNPFYPVLYSVFGGKGWDAARALYYRSIIMGGLRMGPLDYLLLPWNLTVRGAYTYDNFDGIIGPAFLIFLPLAFFTGKKNHSFRFLGIYSLIYFLIWAVISLKVRKLIPVLAPVSLLAGTAAAALLEGRLSRLLKAVVFCVLCLVIGLNLGTIAGDVAKVNPFRFVSGRETNDEFLARNVHNYRAIDFANRNLPDGSAILFIYGGNAWYYSRHPTIVDSIFQDQTIRELLAGSHSPAELREECLRRGITHILVNFNIAAQGLFPALTPEKNKILEEFFKQNARIIFQDGPDYLFAVSH